jgi:hypothetical protein
MKENQFPTKKNFTIPGGKECILLVKQQRILVSTLKMTVKNHHITEKNSNHCRYLQMKISKQSKIRDFLSKYTAHPMQKLLWP